MYYMNESGPERQGIPTGGPNEKEIFNTEKISKDFLSISGKHKVILDQAFLEQQDNITKKLSIEDICTPKYFLDLFDPKGAHNEEEKKARELHLTNVIRLRTKFLACTQEEEMITLANNLAEFFINY